VNQSGKPERSEGLNKRKYAVSSVEKALRLLAAFSMARPHWTVSELAREFRMPKSTAHNLLQTLQVFDLIRQDPEERGYRLGPRAMEMGLVFARSSEVFAQARPVLRRLAERSRETVKLGMLSDDQVLIVAAVESTHQLHTRGDAGTRWALHSTSLGKAILSALPIAEAEGLVAQRGLTRYTGRTVTTWTALRAELGLIRERGYAMDLEENEAGVRCVAAPFVDPLRGAVAAVSLSGPSVRIGDLELDGFAKDVMAAARAIRPQSHLEEQ
jgi:DNA-binding IclR family transcriptional regulator